MADLSTTDLAVRRAVYSRLPDGMSMPIPALWQLAQLWFNERMSPSWAPRTIEQSHQLLTAAGFIGPFWSIGGDR